MTERKERFSDLITVHGVQQDWAREEFVQACYVLILMMLETHSNGFDPCYNSTSFYFSLMRANSGLDFLTREPSNGYF